MLRGRLYTITNCNTSSSSKIRFEDFKQSDRTNPTLAEIEVVDALDDPETGSGTIFINAYASHTKPVVPTLTINHTGNVGVGVSDPQSKLDVEGDVKVSGVLSIAGHEDVKTAIDGKQQTLTGSVDITTGSITATDVTTSGTVLCNGSVTINDTLAINGYSDVEAAIDGKQAVLTTSSDIAVGTVTLDQITFPDNTTMTSAVIDTNANVNRCVPTLLRTRNINTSWRELTIIPIREGDNAMQAVLMQTSGSGSPVYEARVVRLSNNTVVGQANFTAYGNLLQVPVSITAVPDSSALYDLSIQVRRSSETRFPAGVQGFLYAEA